MGQLFFHSFKNSIFYCLCGLVLCGCLPTSYTTPELPLLSVIPNENHRITIAEIKSLYTNNPSLIQDDLYCCATVASNDVAGNFYKELYLQDSTGGLLMKVELSKVSEKFGEGRTVIIKLHNLAFSVENNMPVLGKLNGSKVTSLPENSIDSFIYKTDSFQEILPAKIETEVLPSANLLGTLVAIEGVYFKEGGDKISEITVKNNQNFTVEFINSPITLRVSPYCKFIERRLPEITQRCTVKGVLSRYNNLWSLIISDFQDIVMIDE